MRNIIVLIACCTLFASSLLAEPRRTTGEIHGTVSAAGGDVLSGAQVLIQGTSLGAVSKDGHFHIHGIPAGKRTVTFYMTGYRSLNRTVEVVPDQLTELSVSLEAQTVELDPLIVTGSRTLKRRLDSPTKVDVVPPEAFEIESAVTLGEGLAKTTGVRVENNCQNCNFYSVRLNGMEGAYTQVLMNGRPTVSSLAAVYLLDQLPTSMIDRLEVVKGGGSALYGGSAVAGVVNVITKRPEVEQTTLAAKLGWLSGIPDRTASVTTTLLDDDGRVGSFFFAQTRERNPVDLNSDGFSELGMLESGTFGTQVFYTPRQNLDLSLELHYLKENRRGGDQVTSSRPHEAVVAESIETNRIGGGLNLSHRLNAWTDYTLYTSVALTNRDTYYGGASPVFMDDGSLVLHPDLNAYGQTRNPMVCAGGQLNHRFSLDHLLTVGLEWNRDHLMDHILSYDLLTDETYQSAGLFGQYDWQASAKLNLVAGARLEKHSEIDHPIVSPRLSALYRLNQYTALRGSFSTGFRPPMVFDEDLHITQVGGEGQIIVNAPDLNPEKSYSFSGGIEYNRASSDNQRSLFVSLSGFHTQLKDAFSVQFDRIEGTALINRRVNAGGARVFGAELEVNLRPVEFLFLRGGWTIQRSEYDDAVDISFDEDNPIVTRRFLRTPDLYGYLSADWELFGDKVDLETSLDLTGPMSVINAETNAYTSRTGWFGVFDVKLSRRIGDKRYWKFFVQGHNLFDSYQDDLDRVVLSGDPSKFHMRDSGYVYGPDRPRSFYTGVEMGF